MCRFRLLLDQSTQTTGQGSTTRFQVLNQTCCQGIMTGVHRRRNGESIDGARRSSSGAAHGYSNEAYLLSSVQSGEVHFSCGFPHASMWTDASTATPRRPTARLPPAASASLSSPLNRVS